MKSEVARETADIALLKKLYAAFNARDLDGALTAMHVDVTWPNAMEGGVVHGREGIRQYWSRQWAMIDPQVDPTSFSIDDAGDVVISVHQVVRELSGKLLLDRMVKHVYTIEDGLVRRMEIRD